MSQQLGRYELRRPIGRGGMAEVWLGSRRGVGGIEKRVVIKRIIRSRASDPRYLDLFVREAEISMALAHRNIVPTFDFGRVGNELFLVMEYVHGPNLALALSKARKLGCRPDNILTSHIILQACQALSYAHQYTTPEGLEQNIAHRDVTPGNLLLSFAGEVMLGDFGLAAATSDAAEGDGKTRGTPGYMAPEQAAGAHVGPAADIYSLGLIMHEMLLLKRVRSGTPEEQIAAASTPLDPLPDEIPEVLRDICERATQLLPADRCSATEMISDLDHYLVQARAAESTERRAVSQRLADWLKEIHPEGQVVGSGKGKLIEGSAVTFLDNGADSVLAAGGATLRSMAATGIEDAPAEASSDAAENTSDSEAENTSDSEAVPKSEKSESALESIPRSRSRGFLIAGLTVLGLFGAAAIFMTRSNDESAELAVGADYDASPRVIVTFDSGTMPYLQDAASPEAASPEAALPDASPTADAGSLDVSGQARSAVVRRRISDARPRAMALLKVSSTPWATVRVVGRSESCDETPCQLRLPEGKYRVTLANPVAGLRKTIGVTLSSDAPTQVHEVLEHPQR